jgi:bacterioferritin-associated ferredoxin
VAEANDPLRWYRHPAAVLGAPGRLAEAAGYLGTLARHRVPLWRRTAVTAVTRDGAGLLATLERLDPGRRLRPGRRRVVGVDAVCVGHGFTPAVELAVALGCRTATDPRDGSLVVVADAAGRTCVPGVFAAGELTGVGGARLAATEGALAGLAAARLAGRPAGEADPGGTRQEVRPLLARRRREGRFADALHAVYPVPDGWLERVDGDTVLCRCEEVTAGAARAAAALGADDARSLKLLSRVGMGRCQGRICGWPAAHLLAAATARAPDLAGFAHRPLAHPVPLGQFL